MSADSIRLVRCGLVVLAVTAIAACTDNPNAPSNAARYSQTDLRVGTGVAATSGATLSVLYTGWFYDGSKSDHKGAEFDSSVGRGPLSFTLGTGQVIAGWDQGVPGMRVGGLRQLVIPPVLAYGAVRNGPIPPNATLLFEIELLDVQ
jgi:FKBP-type peptidyl-prolyl cis-trans isomerase FkpA